MRFDDTQRARINRFDFAYHRCGDGDPVLLLHPVGLDSSWWRPFAERVAADFFVLAPDFRGHGRSALIRKEIELADLADDIGGLLRSLALPPVRVVGLSMGGMVAQYLALRHPNQIRSLALLATACTIPDQFRQDIAQRGEIARQEGMPAVVQSTIERWFTPAALSSPLVELCRRKLMENDAQSWAWCWRAISRLQTLPLLPRISVPTLVVTGTQDLSAPPEAASLIARTVRHARLEIIEGAPHMGAFESPDSYLSTVDAFLHGRDQS